MAVNNSKGVANAADPDPERMILFVAGKIEGGPVVEAEYHALLQPGVEAETECHVFTRFFVEGSGRLLKRGCLLLRPTRKIVGA